MKTSSKLVSIAILLLGTVMLNWIASMAKNVRLDTTAEKTYSLTKGTKEILGKISGDIDIELHFSRSREDVPVYIKSQADRVLSLLQQFDDNYKGDNGDINQIPMKRRSLKSQISVSRDVWETLSSIRASRSYTKVKRKI